MQSACAAMLMLGACGLAADEADPPPPDDAATGSASTTDVQNSRSGEADDCLPDLWETQADPDREFDRAHDLAEGGKISCATGTTPSEFAAMLADIRTAAAAGDRLALLREIDVPMLYIDDAGERRDLSDPAELEAQAEDIFPPEMLSVMARLTLDDITVVPQQGAFFELGSIWLVATERGGRPRLRTVNRQALNEAILSAAEEHAVLP